MLLKFEAIYLECKQLHQPHQLNNQPIIIIIINAIQHVERLRLHIRGIYYQNGYGIYVEDSDVQ